MMVIASEASENAIPETGGESYQHRGKAGASIAQVSIDYI
jgi:hypothetical protein